MVACLAMDIMLQLRLACFGLLVKGRVFGLDLEASTCLLVCGKRKKLEPAWVYVSGNPPWLEAGTTQRCFGGWTVARWPW